MSDKHVYRFDEGDKSMRELLGGKGANLAEMTSIGLPVPPGFTITTEVCNHYSAHGDYPAGVDIQVEDALKALESDTGKTFGDAADPLLLSVRSGARASMPGMMDTILNLGLNDETVQGVIGSTGNARFAYDCYRRFVSMYGDVVLGCKPESAAEGDVFEERLEAMKKRKGVKLDTDLTADDLKDLVAEFKTAVKERTGGDFPDDPRAQLWGAVSAVFGSWGNDRAVAYRRMYDIPDDWGTAVNVQTMVYGNTGEESGSGVGFTRNPASGEKEFYGEFLINSQGEDVVAGTRTPRPVSELEGALAAGLRRAHGDPADARARNARHAGLRVHRRGRPPLHAADAQRQAHRSRRDPHRRRHGGRGAHHAGRGAHAHRARAAQPAAAAHLRTERQGQEPCTKAGSWPRACRPAPAPLPAASCFSAQDAVTWAARGEKVLLVRDFTSPDDIRGMDAAQGILTAQGGMTSHAALVGRQMGKVCIVGCGALDIDMKARSFKVDRRDRERGRLDQHRRLHRRGHPR